MAGYIVSEYMKRNAQRFSYKNFMESLNGIIDTDNTMYYYIYSINTITNAYIPNIYTGHCLHYGKDLNTAINHFIINSLNNMFCKYNILSESPKYRLTNIYLYATQQITSTININILHQSPVPIITLEFDSILGNLYVKYKNIITDQDKVFLNLFSNNSILLEYREKLLEIRKNNPLRKKFFKGFKYYNKDFCNIII